MAPQENLYITSFQSNLLWLKFSVLWLERGKGFSGLSTLCTIHLGLDENGAGGVLYVASFMCARPFPVRYKFCKSLCTSLSGQRNLVLSRFTASVSPTKKPDVVLFSRMKNPDWIKCDTNLTDIFLPFLLRQPPYDLLIQFHKIWHKLI